MKSSFEQQLADCYKCGKIKQDLKKRLTNIVDDLLRTSNFMGYTFTFKRRMRSEALKQMLLTVKNKKFRLNAEYNPFSYFVKIAYGSFCRTIVQERRKNENKRTTKN